MINGMGRRREWAELLIALVVVVVLMRACDPNDPRICDVTQYRTFDCSGGTP